MAGGLGFEPRLTESESAVLPLNYPPPKWLRIQRFLGWSCTRASDTSASGAIVRPYTGRCVPGLALTHVHLASRFALRGALALRLLPGELWGSSLRPLLHLAEETPGRDGEEK